MRLIGAARAPAPNGAASANASDFGCNPGAEDNTTCPSALALDEPMDTDYAQNGYAYDATSGYSYSTTTADFASNHAGPSHSGGYTEEYAPWDEAGNGMLYSRCLAQLSYTFARVDVCALTCIRPSLL